MSGPIISSFCSGGDCVQVERIGDVIAVRHTKDRHRELLFTPAEWDAFIAGAKNGEFNREALR